VTTCSFNPKPFAVLLHAQAFKLDGLFYWYYQVFAHKLNDIRHDKFYSKGISTSAVSRACSLS
jgi:hypothetical protein